MTQSAIFSAQWDNLLGLKYNLTAWYQFPISPSAHTHTSVLILWLHTLLNSEFKLFHEPELTSLTVKLYKKSEIYNKVLINIYKTMNVAINYCLTANSKRMPGAMICTDHVVISIMSSMLCHWLFPDPSVIWPHLVLQRDCTWWLLVHRHNHYKKNSCKTTNTFFWATPQNYSLYYQYLIH